MRFRKLQRVVLPSTITRIHKYSFEEDSLLAVINIPASVEKIGKEAFLGCVALDTLFMQGSVPPELGTDVFSAYTATLVVPADAVETYRQHEVFGLFNIVADEDVSAIVEIGNDKSENGQSLDLYGRVGIQSDGLRLIKGKKVQFNH